MLLNRSIDGDKRNRLVDSFGYPYDESCVQQLLTIDDVAALLKVPKSWVYEHTRKRGLEKLPYVKLGKYLRFEEKAVLAYVSKHRKNS